MELIINFKDRGKVELQLKYGRVLIDSLTFEFESNLDMVLISAVDKILKENRIEELSLKTVRVEGDIDKNSSAYKIVQTFIGAWKVSKQANIAGS